MKWTAWILVFGIALALPGRAPAQGFGDLSGSLDVSHVDARVDGERQDSLRQLYTLSFLRPVTPTIDLRAGLRYYKFDLDFAEALTGSFQEEIQPSGDLSWRHPWFRFTANGSRRISRSNVISGDLITDSVLLNWVSAWRETPEFSLRYELQDTEETGSAATRSTQDRRLTAGVDYQRTNESFNYQFTRQWNENVISGLKSTENAQRFLYRGMHDLGARSRASLSTSYRYTRRDRVSEVGTGGRFLELVEPARGLFAVDPTPELGALGDAPGLIDGNTVTPVVPPIQIGAGQIDRNIGVDLGVRRDRVGAIYIFTDRLSASSVSWSVWVSEDNLNWTRPGLPAVTSRFVPALSRYELEFAETPARYVKVVNSGLNAVPDVAVTEIQVFEALPITDDVEQDASSHLADARLTWDASRKWRFSVDTVGRLEPPSGSLSQRLEYNYGLQARYRTGGDWSHVLRWGQSWREQAGEDRDLREDNAAYAVIYAPLPTLSSSISATARQTSEGDETTQRIANALFTTTAIPLTTLRSTFELGASRVDQVLADFLTDSWQTRLSVDTDVTRQLRVDLTWYHQESWNGPDREMRVLRRLSAGGELQITSAIFARASTGIQDDEVTSRSDEYLLSWRLFSRLLLTGQANLDKNDAGFEVRRYSVNANLDVFDRFLFLRNVTAYVRFSDLDQSEAGGARILSWQQGLRATF